MLRNMRTPLLATVLSLSLVGCFVGDEGTAAPGGDDDDGQTNPPPTGSNSGRVDVTFDKITLDTELKTANPINVTVKGSEGFSGPVNLSASIVDGTGAVVPGWAVTLSAPSVTLTADGTATAVAMVTIPAMSTGLTGMLKVTSTSAAKSGTTAATSAITAAKTVTFNIKVDATGKCVYPVDGGNTAAPVTVAVGTKIRFFNSGTANFEIHSFNKPLIAHQGQDPGGTADPVTEANTAFEQTPSITGVTSWYCHAPGPDLNTSNPRIVVQ